MKSPLRRRILAAVGVAAAAAIALTGCSSSGSGSSSSGGKVTLTLWFNSADTPAEKAIYTAWEKKTGNTLKLVSIPAAGFEDATMTRWATGSRPDLLEFHPVRGFLAGLNPEENLQPLDGIIKEYAWRAVCHMLTVGKKDGGRNCAACVGGARRS